MTNQEAIQMLKNKIDGSVDTSYEWCECVRLAIKALEATDVKLAEQVEEYRNLLEECERKLSYLLDCEIESTLESQKVKELIDKIQVVISVYQKPSQQDIYKAVLGLWSPEDALTTVQEMNEKAKEVKNIMNDCPEKCDGCKSFKEEEHPLISLRYYLCEKTGMAIQKHIGGYLPHELTPDIFSNEGIKVQEGEADEWERVLMSGDKRAIAQYKADHGFTMTKEEMDILEEEK